MSSQAVVGRTSIWEDTSYSWAFAVGEPFTVGASPAEDLSVLGAPEAEIMSPWERARHQALEAAVTQDRASGSSARALDLAEEGAALLFDNAVLVAGIVAFIAIVAAVALLGPDAWASVSGFFDHAGQALHRLGA